jgi:hypothetical protein
MLDAKGGVLSGGTVLLLLFVVDKPVRTVS